MWAPTSAILADIFLQYIKHNYMVPILIKHKIVCCYIYTDDNLIIYNLEKTNTESVFHEFNSIFPSLNFAREMEKDNSLSFLHLTI
jgi:hypothetical protein